MVSGYADQVEADLQRYYHLDLRDLWRGGLTLRRIGALIRQLPPDSATISALAAEVVDIADVPDGAAPRLWSVDQQLLASVVDSLAIVQWTVAQTNSKERLPPPTMLARPGAAKTATRPTATPQQIARMRARNSGKEPHNGD